MKALLLLVLLLATPAVAQHTRADMQCKAIGKQLIYDCIIRAARDDQPMSAQLTVGADMPSMGHEVKPVKARPGKGPGEYVVRLDLDMTGEWDVRLRFSGPVRDQVVLHYLFDERGARAVRRSAPAPRK
jgi:hypothetical protein